MSDCCRHHYGRSFGSTLDDFEKLKGVENKGEKLKETDPRPAEHTDITTSPRSAHIPGCEDTHTGARARAHTAG